MGGSSSYPDWIQGKCACKHTNTSLTKNSPSMKNWIHANTVRLIVWSEFLHPQNLLAATEAHHRRPMLKPKPTARPHELVRVWVQPTHQHVLLTCSIYTKPQTRAHCPTNSSCLSQVVTCFKGHKRNWGNKKIDCLSAKPEITLKTYRTHLDCQSRPHWPPCHQLCLGTGAKEKTISNWAWGHFTATHLWGSRHRLAMKQCVSRGFTALKLPIGQSHKSHSTSTRLLPQERLTY